ncbi:hypothetical protein GHT06_006751 [Daphnia sinensis]|uniref:Uncharacterized protein n=1 Tax=Daphnia sinensis TaxID=1820382 RepID=A0AAD5PMH5_9CRUS|nr:hypothetical protein GHT06_006751 [Daphnia sinensis]
MKLVSGKQHSFLRMVLSLSMLCQLEGSLFFTELYHFHGIYCLSVDSVVHISSVMMHFLNTPIPEKIF